MVSLSFPFPLVEFLSLQRITLLFSITSGKYVGTRPVKISKATTGVGAVEIGDKKAREMDLKKKAKSGTKPYERAKLAELESGGPNNGRGGKNSGFGPEKDRKSYIRR